MSEPSASAFDRFRNLTRRLLAVPKADVAKHVPTPRKPKRKASKKK